MSHEQSPPNSSRRRSKMVRKQSSGSFSIEELFPDDMGYDADVEVIRPDRYEEPESQSDNEDEITTRQRFRTLDEELAARMRRLGHEQRPLSPLPPSSSELGRKRKSIEMELDRGILATPPSPDLEVQEVLDVQDQPSPAKRRRRKSRRPNVAQHILRCHDERWTDSSDKTDSNTRGLKEISTSPTTASDQANPREDSEAMDVT